MKIQIIKNKEILPKPAKLDGIKYILQECGCCRIKPKHQGWAKAIKVKIDGNEYIIYSYGCQRIDRILRKAVGITNKLLR